SLSGYGQRGFGAVLLGVHTLAPYRQSYQRTSAAPQVKPPPIASNNNRSPRLMRRSASASARASGIDAAEVFPWRSTVVTIFPGAMPSLCAEPSIIRLFA